MLSMASLALACMAGLLVTLLIWSCPGKPRPFTDEYGRPLPGSISEKIFVIINGARQGMFIKSRDPAKPVLLYLHGGMPDYFLTEKYPPGLEDLFTVCWWEQRGSGISYGAASAPGTVTPDQLVSDALAVTQYLRRRFHKDRIYLMGHSGGTFIGIQAAARAPELFHAYIGVAQMSNQLKSEKLAYDYMLGRFKANGNVNMARKLEAAPVTMEGGVPEAYLALRDEAMHRLGIGTTHDMRSVVTGIFLRSLQSREYTIREKIDMWRAKASSGVSIVWDAVLATDCAEKVPSLDIPIYFFHGIYDYTCSYSLAKEYFGRLRAPVKGFYTFRESAHSPIFEEPEKARKILHEDVLAGACGLADGK